MLIYVAFYTLPVVHYLMGTLATKYVLYLKVCLFKHKMALPLSC